MNVGSLFSGAGLLDYGLHLAGLRHAWLCESDPWRRSILERRWPRAPVYADVREIGAGSVRRVDVIAGGFPCKGASTAGKREGFGHPETVLWREMARAVGELRPHYVLLENVANLLAIHDGALWGEVLGDLATLGFDVEWDCLPAASLGAPHLRDRVFAITRHPDRQRLEEPHGAESGAPQLAGAADAGADAADSASIGATHEGGDGRRGADTRRVSAVGGGEAAAHARGERRPAGWLGQQQGGRLSRAGRRDELGAGGEAVDWREFAPAIRRWEEVLGRPAPEPLVRRVDDGRPRGLDRSRLSALGDGVLVQAGWLVGRYLMERAGVQSPAPSEEAA